MAAIQRRTVRKTVSYRTSFGPGVQHIGLGFVHAEDGKLKDRLSPLLWLGKRLEQFGRRLQGRAGECI